MRIDRQHFAQLIDVDYYHWREWHEIRGIPKRIVLSHSVFYRFKNVYVSYTIPTGYKKTRDVKIGSFFDV